MTALAVEKAVSLARFTTMRLQAMSLLQAAAKLPGLPEHLRVQAAAAAMLAGIRLHQIYRPVSSEDAHEIRKELSVIAGHIVDPLIEAIARDAAAHLPGIDQGLFRGQLALALQNAAALNLHKIAEAMQREGVN